MGLGVYIIGGAIASYALFVRWRIKLMRRCIREGSGFGPAWLQRLAAAFQKFLANINGVKIVSEGGEGMKADPSRNYIYVWHPHGFISYVPAYLMGGMAIDGKPHGRPWFGTCIPVLFNVPFIGEIFALTNARPVDKKTIESLLGKGASIAIQPGGVREQAASRHDQEQAFFPGKLGFIRMAIKYGTPLIPLYVFGENQLYRRLDGLEWLTKLIQKTIGMTFPFITAKFGIPMAGLMPLATDVHLRWGSPIDVGEPDAEPSDARIEEIYTKYVAELQRLFDANAKDCLPPAVAEKGLKITRVEDKAPRSDTAKSK